LKEKEKIIEMIQSLPDDSTVDDIMDEHFSAFTLIADWRNLTKARAFIIVK
jgi:hypothetical protein